MSDPQIVSSRDLSVGWARAFIAVMSTELVSPLTVSIEIQEDEVPQELAVIRGELDSTLQSLGLQSVHTVANTIFPSSLWDPLRPRRRLFDMFFKIESAVLKERSNNNGTYFQRLVDYRNEGVPSTGVNQLDHVIETWTSGNHRYSALQAAIFDPNKDHVHSRRRGFPCLHQVAFVPDWKRKTLTVSGFYGRQYIFDKAYGNYVGLARLGAFMAHEMELTLKRVICTASVGSLGGVRKRDVRQLEAIVQTVIAERNLADS